MGPALALLADLSDACAGTMVSPAVGNLTDDNDDGDNDFIGYYSGDNSSTANHPQLVVVYQP